MKAIEARMGLSWIKEGFRIFRKRPFLLANLFIAYFVLMLIIKTLPMVGAVLPALIAPCFSIFFLQAIHDANEEWPFSFSRMMSIFRREVVLRLVVVGALYLAGTFIAVYLSSFIDGGTFMRAMGGQEVEVQALLDPAFNKAVMVTALLLFLVHVLFWFVTPLIAWKNMPFGQSLFYSVFTLFRAWKAFLVYLLGLLLFGFFIPMLISSLVMMMLGQNIGLIVTFSLLMMVVVLVYCSFYSMYIYVFGKPSPAAQA